MLQEIHDWLGRYCMLDLSVIRAKMSQRILTTKLNSEWQKCHKNPLATNLPLNKLRHITASLDDVHSDSLVYKKNILQISLFFVPSLILRQGTNSFYNVLITIFSPVQQTALLVLQLIMRPINTINGSSKMPSKCDWKPNSFSFLINPYCMSFPWRLLRYLKSLITIFCYLLVTGFNPTIPWTGSYFFVLGFQ